MRAIVVGLVLLRLVGSGCESEPSVTGADDVFVLPGAQITLSSYAIVDNGLQANGTVKNAGTTRYAPYWYVEGDFYSDSTFTLKLGGAVKSFSFPLEPGVATPLVLRFSSQTIDVNQFPHFRVGNLRAYREQQ